MSIGLIFEEPTQNVHVCSVCQHKINDSIHRIVYFSDPKKIPFARRFHYFFPCWDMQFIAQNYIHQKIISAGFSCEKNILNNLDTIKSLQRNSSLWE